MLEQELKEKESELEDLGCWRWLLAKVDYGNFDGFYLNIRLAEP